MADRQLPTSKHFRLEQLADGVYAAVHSDGGEAISNAGIVDLGDRTLVYDTFFTPQAAADLRLAAETLTNRPVDVVIDSHSHNDHVWGNQVFGADTDIVSTIKTRQSIVEHLAQTIASYKQRAPQNLAAAQADLETAQDERQRRQRVIWVDYWRGFLQAQDELRLRLPNITFGDRLVLHGSRRSAELVPYAGGHTESDTVLHMPAEGIVFMSDLLFIECHPVLGDPDRLLQILDDVEALGARVFVPGHGRVGGVADLEPMRQYVRTLVDLAHKLAEEGEPEEAIHKLSVPHPFQDWVAQNFFTINMRSLVRRQQSRD
jgi:glyoxylase-like metal-dependent hydrolase (beta-lactamase superfamily II)